MWLHQLVMAILLAAQAAPRQAPLTDEHVARIIHHPGKMTDPYVCVGRSLAPEFLVCIQGPDQRVGLAAAMAKQARRPFGPADVPGDARAQTWTITVQPNRPTLHDGRPVRTALAEALTLEVHGRPNSSMRLAVALVEVAWDNAVGVEVKGQGLTATLDASTLPAGDLDVVVGEAGGTERRYRLTQSARAQIR